MGVLLAALGMLLLLGVVLALFAGSLTVLRRSRARVARLGDRPVAVGDPALARWGWAALPGSAQVSLPSALTGPGATCDLVAIPDDGDGTGRFHAVQVRFPAAAPFGWADGPVVWAVVGGPGSGAPPGVLVVDRRRTGPGGGLGGRLGPDRPTGDEAFDARFRVVRWVPAGAGRGTAGTAGTTGAGAGAARPAAPPPGPVVRQRVVDLAADHLVVQDGQLTAAWDGHLDPARLTQAAQALRALRSALGADGEAAPDGGRQ